MHDQRLIADIRVLDGAGQVREPVPAGNGQHHGLGIQQVRVEDLPVERRPGQAQVESAAEEALDLLAGDEFLQVDIHVRDDFRDLLQQGAEDAEAAGGREAHAEHARAPGGDPPGGDGRAGGQGHKPPGFLEERLAGRGELHLPVVALQQFRADDLFQFLDLPAQGRLRHVQPFRCPAEVQFLGHGDESGQLVKRKHDAFRVSPDAYMGLDMHHSGSLNSFKRANVIRFTTVRGDPRSPYEEFQ